VNYRFSVVTPVFDPEPAVLDATIRSVVQQSYPGWELCLADDCSTRPGVREVLDKWRDADPRIKLVYREANGGISAASNTALAISSGDFVVLLDHDDVLHPDALGALNHCAVYVPTVDVIYTDEDKIGLDGEHTEEFRKPGWSPELLEGCMYLGHVTCYRRSLLQAVGGFREGYEGSQDWDLALRMTEQARRIVHVPKVLYHWRASQASVALSVEAKPYAVDAGRRAVQDHLERTGQEAFVDDSPIPGWFFIRRRMPVSPLVSAIIPTAGVRRSVSGDQDVLLIERCLRGLLEQTDYPNLEVICIASGNAPQGLGQHLEHEFGSAIRFRRTEGPFNYASTMNLGAMISSGSRLLLLNDDTAPLSSDWLTHLVEAVENEEIGVAGAKLLYGDGKVQHAGVVHDPHGVPHHPHAGFGDGPGYFGDLMLTVNYMAVTGACQLIRRGVFEEVGGLDPGLPLNFNDIDLCLKVLFRGYRNVVVNRAALWHFESATRSKDVTYREMDTFSKHWAEIAREDPYTRAFTEALPFPTGWR
jgi:GT2 family glycosyltransferase